MSKKISQTPAVLAGVIADNDFFPIVAGGVTSRVDVSEIRARIGSTPPAGGRTVTDSTTFLLNNAVWNVKDFGAVGDGVADDNSVSNHPIQDAIDAAASAGGGIVRLPKGTYGYSVSPQLKFGVTLVGDHETASVLKPLANVHGLALEAYGVGLGAVNVYHLGFDGINTTGKAAIHNGGTLDRTQQSYGLNIKHNIVQNFNIGIQLRSWRNIRIEKNWFQNVTQGADLTGWLLDVFLLHNYFVKNTGAGAGTSNGITVNSFNFTTNGGVSRPETVHIFDNVVFGFDTAISLLSALNVKVSMNDIQANIIGVEFTSIEAGLNIRDNYVQLSGAAATNGIIGHGLGSPLSQGKVNIRDNTVIGSGTTAASGITVNDAGNQNQDHIEIDGNIVVGWTSADIRINNGNDIQVLRNRCLDSVLGLGGIYVLGGNGPGQIRIDGNDTHSIVLTNPALVASGLVDLGINEINGARVGVRDTFTSPTYAAGNFTGTGAMTWGVDAVDVTTFEYTIQNKRATVIFAIGNTTIGGTVSNELRIALPAGVVANKAAFNPIVLFDGTSTVVAQVSIDAGGSALRITKLGGANFALVTNALGVWGQITFEIQ